MTHPDFSVFPELNTPRLKLRKLEATDVQQIHELRSSVTVNKFLDREPSTGIPDALIFIHKITENVENNNSLYWAICLSDAPELIGTICLWNFQIPAGTIEIGYELLPRYHGRGLMTEAMKAVIDYAFNKLNAENIFAFTSADNLGSIKLLIKTGFEATNETADPACETVGNLTAYSLIKP